MRQRFSFRRLDISTTSYKRAHKNILNPDFAVPTLVYDGMALLMDTAVSTFGPLAWMANLVKSC